MVVSSAYNSIASFTFEGPIQGFHNFLQSPHMYTHVTISRMRTCTEFFEISNLSDHGNLVRTFEM